MNGAQASQIFEIKGDKLAELAQLVKRVGDQQKDLIVDISKQLSAHNDTTNQALAKQARMEQKITNIEEQLMKHKQLGYKRKLEKLEKRKSENRTAKRFAEDMEEVKELVGSHPKSASRSHSRGRKSSSGGNGTLLPCVLLSI